MRTFWDRPLGSKLILVLCAVFLVEMGAPWQRICAATSGDEARICGWRTGYEGSNFGLYAALLAGALLAWELLPVVIPRLSMRGWMPAIVTALLGIAIAISTLIKVIQDNEFQTTWAWVGLGLVAAIALTALLRVRYRWGTRNARPAPAPSGGQVPG
jgi:hypothetical protein